jgi:pyruvate ferredoxin oxidoreductase alpha subunit
VESEFAALSVAIGASAAGARAYTADGQPRIAVHGRSRVQRVWPGAADRDDHRQPGDWSPHQHLKRPFRFHGDAHAGWIQLFAETSQEAADLHIIAFRLSEELSCPVMVCMDGFILTHACERVDMPTQEQVDAYLPPFEPRRSIRPSLSRSARRSGRKHSPKFVTSRITNSFER